MTTKYLVALVVLTALMTLGPALFWRRPPASIKRFFEEAASPFPLAFFRITFFFSCFLLFDPQAVRFSQLSPELLFPPPGWDWILSVVPVREQETRILTHANSVLLILSGAGLWTRWSIIGSLITSIWVYGIPEFYGKIDHYHHLIWFMAVFAVSPCADVLSLDAIRKAIRRADRGIVAPPPESIVYDLPLRMFSLLIGVIYFWAGFWKAWTGRLDWAFSENMRFTLYNKWWELNWIPAFRIDHYPVLYQTAAGMTMLWEMSFLFLLLHPALRHLGALAGLAFHNGTAAFMRINFLTLQFCYVCLMDWDRIWRWLGLRLFRTQMQVVYDGNCELCRRTIAPCL